MMDVKNPEKWDGKIDEKDDPYTDEITEGQRFRAELLSALIWTCMLSVGLTPGRPYSAFGKIVRTIGIQLIRCALLCRNSSLIQMTCFDFELYTCACLCTAS